MEHRSWSMEAMTWAGRIWKMAVLAERERHSSAMGVTTWVVHSWRRDDVSDAFWPVEVRTIGWDDLAVRHSLTMVEQLGELVERHTSWKACVPTGMVRPKRGRVQSSCSMAERDAS